MADGDQRIEVLEDEMKVLKGEVSRTLVDLRALLMREDSPLMAGGLLKRIVAPADSGPNITTQVTLAPVAESPASNISIVAPAAADQAPSVVAVQPGQESSALAGLPGLGGIEMPEAPGAPDEALFPSQGDEVSVPTAAPPSDTGQPPSAPDAGDISPPAAAPDPADKSDSGWEEERDEERARQRRARLQEQETEEEAQRAQRARQREAEREEEGADRDRRNRRREQERDEDEDQDRLNRRRREEDDDSRRYRPAGRNESELEEELDRSRRRNEELEYEMERQSNSLASQDDRETGPDPLDREAEDDGDTMGLDTGEEDSDYSKDDGYGPDQRSNDHVSGAGADQDSEYDLDYSLQTGTEGEIGHGYSAGHESGYADDRDENLEYPPAFGPPALSPEDNFDSHEYQEAPKINGYNRSRRPRRPDEGRRAYEDSYYEDREDRNQEFDREPQAPPRSQRMSRPLPDDRGEPRGRRPAPDYYAYPPNGGTEQWGQPPAGYQQRPAPQDWAPVPAPMDLNLVSSLVRWASLAKSRVGEKRLSDIIELYVESRSATAGLKEALTHIASIVDDQPPESGQSSQETLDLIAHLHGILTAALPVPEVPKINSQISFGTGKGNANANGNGDW